MSGEVGYTVDEGEHDDEVADEFVSPAFDDLFEIGFFIDPVSELNPYFPVVELRWKHV